MEMKCVCMRAMKISLPGSSAVRFYSTKEGRGSLAREYDEGPTKPGSNKVFQKWYTHFADLCECKPIREELVNISLCSVTISKYLVQSRILTGVCLHLHDCLAQLGHAGSVRYLYHC